MTQAPAVSWRSLFFGEGGLALCVICLGIVVHASNVPLTATVLPSAVAEIGGLEYLSWASTIYLVASIMTSVSGVRLRRQLGSRKAYFAAAALFAFGTVLCAGAPDMAIMVVGRGIQGAGGGLILALGYSLIRSTIPEPAWAKAFALVSGVWGISAISGGIVGGLFTDLASWRGAYLLMLPLLALLVVLARVGLTAQVPMHVEVGPYPLARLLLIGLSILCVAVSANIPWAGARVAVIIGALVPMVGALRLDASAQHRLLPHGAFGLRTVVGIGLWIVLLLMIALYGFSVYGPVLLQTLHTIPATVAGAFIAWTSLSWTAGSMITAHLPEHEERLMLAGPVFIMIGLLGLAVCLPGESLWPVSMLLFCLGAGIGIAWAPLNQRIMRSAFEGDEEIAATAIPTTQMIGFAFGAALAGLVANTAGFDRGLSSETATSVAAWMFALFSLAPGLAFVLVLRLWAFERRMPMVAR